jgi:flagellar assembly factor FliW
LLVVRARPIERPPDDRAGRRTVVLSIRLDPDGGRDTLLQEDMMQVESTRFGTVEVADDEVVVFDDGLPGFAGRRRMVLLGGGQLPGSELDAQHHTVFWLQDVTDPDLAFMTIVPWSAYPDYDIDIDASELDASDPDDVCVLSIVTVRREHGGVRLTSNLLAPVVIDTVRRRGRQIILQDQDWPLQAPLAEVRPRPSSGADAGSVEC